MGFCRWRPRAQAWMGIRGAAPAEVLLGPTVLIICINVAMILDAIKEAMFCASPAAAEPGRPLRAASMGEDSQDPAMGGDDDAQAPRKPKSHSSKGRPEKPRKGKRSKGRKEGRTARGGRQCEGGRALDLNPKVLLVERAVREGRAGEKHLRS